ncbi:MAG TPA: DUF423 domain-containing protein [Rhodanobacteraceae bacterium]|jgi:uncharacterized membrane protein YgdD (TMEM256/DUF423 family)|nr:DUF423 domain-containing protein [Rhodanobacteraceae bacterium]
MTDAGTMRWPGMAAAVAGASAVVLGALGAHALHARLSPQMLDVWHVAVQFQFWHALALLACALLRRSQAANLAALLFAIGIALFCGSLYALASGAPHLVGAITPVGGLAFIAGWIVLGIAFWHGHGR